MVQVAMPRRAKRVTIRDVAAKAGVAVCTVSSALHGTGRISQSERERIQRLAVRLGYHAKVVAQLLRARVTGHVGLVLAGEADVAALTGSGHSGPILGHFLDLCAKKDLPYYVEFFRPPENSRFAPPPKLAGGIVDGVLVGGYVSRELRAWLQQDNRCWVGLCEPSDFCVVSADDQGTCEAVQKLAALGHRHIAYAGGPRKFLTHRLALTGFRRAMCDLGLPVRDDWSYDPCSRQAVAHREVENGACWAAHILASNPRPTAIIAQGTSFVRGVMYQAAQLKLAVPRDLSVMARGQGIDAERALPILSTIEIDFCGLVEQALQMLLHRLDGQNEKPQTCRIPPRLVLRETVAENRVP